MDSNFNEPIQWRKHINGVLLHIILASALLNLFALCGPLISMVIFNKVLPYEAISTLNAVALGGLCLYTFDAMLRAARGYISVHTGARADAFIGSQVVAHVLRLPLRFFEQNPSGALTERLRQLDTVRAFLTGQIPLLLADLAFSVILLALLFIIDWRMGCATLAAIPFFAGISLLCDRAQIQQSRLCFEAAANKASATAEMITNAVTIKSLALEADIEARHGQLLAGTAWTGFRAQNLSSYIASGGLFIHSLVSLGVLYMGARLIVAGEITIGELIGANMLVGRILSPIRSVSAAWNSLRDAQYAFKRLKGLMSERAEGGNSTITAPKLRGHVVVEDIHFAYREDGAPVLDGVSMHCQPGNMIGIVGPPGCGKSTLGKIILGLYAPTRGRALIDGIDTRHMAPEALRGSIGYVPQEIQLFSGTICDNILMGAANASPERAIRAAQFVGAHDFIQRLPHGYKTVLGDRGTGLSSGQRQLICIARALAREPKLIVLDEATSALDGATEEALLRNLRQVAIKARISVIFITHRLGALRLCDEVYAMHEGRIAVRDSHESLPEPISPPTMRATA